MWMAGVDIQNSENSPSSLLGMVFGGFFRWVSAVSSFFKGSLSTYPSRQKLGTLRVYRGLGFRV